MDRARTVLAVIGATAATAAILLHYYAFIQAYLGLPSSIKTVPLEGRGGGECVLVKGLPRGAEVVEAMLVEEDSGTWGVGGRQVTVNAEWSPEGLVVCLPGPPRGGAYLVISIRPPLLDRLLGVPGLLQLKIPVAGASG